MFRRNTLQIAYNSFLQFAIMYFNENRSVFISEMFTFIICVIYIAGRLAKTDSAEMEQTIAEQY